MGQQAHSTYLTATAAMNQARRTAAARLTASTGESSVVRSGLITLPLSPLLYTCLIWLLLYVISKPLQKSAGNTSGTERSKKESASAAQQVRDGLTVCDDGLTVRGRMDRDVDAAYDCAVHFCDRRATVAHEALHLKCVSLHPQHLNTVAARRSWSPCTSGCVRLRSRHRWPKAWESVWSSWNSK